MIALMDADVDCLLEWPGPEAAALRLHLMPERTAWWPDGGTLFAADLHLGKAAVFRARGVPVPQGTTTETLERLSRAVDRMGAKRLVVLGDFLHAKESHAAPTLAALKRWRERHAALACDVVTGNHDRHAGAVEASLGFRTLPDAFEADALIGVHEERDLRAPEPHRLVLAGHVHPTVTLRGAFDRLRLPCFWLRGNVLTLPAFGAFTGGYDIGAAEGRAYAVADDIVVALPRRTAKDSDR